MRNAHQGENHYKVHFQSNNNGMYYHYSYYFLQLHIKFSEFVRKGSSIKMKVMLKQHVRVVRPSECILAITVANCNKPITSQV